MKIKKRLIFILTAAIFIAQHLIFSNSQAAGNKTTIKLEDNNNIFWQAITHGGDEKTFSDILNKIDFSDQETRASLARGIFQSPSYWNDERIKTNSIAAKILFERMSPFEFNSFSHLCGDRQLSRDLIGISIDSEKYDRNSPVWQNIIIKLCIGEATFNSNLAMDFLKYFEKKIEISSEVRNSLIEYSRAKHLFKFENYFKNKNDDDAADQIVKAIISGSIDNYIARFNYWKRLENGRPPLTKETIIGLLEYYDKEHSEYAVGRTLEFALADFAELGVEFPSENEKIDFMLLKFLNSDDYRKFSIFLDGGVSPDGKTLKKSLLKVAFEQNRQRYALKLIKRGVFLPTETNPEENVLFIADDKHWQDVVDSLVARKAAVPDAYALALGAAKNSDLDSARYWLNKANKFSFNSRRQVEVQAKIESVAAKLAAEEERARRIAQESRQSQRPIKNAASKVLFDWPFNAPLKTKSWSILCGNGAEVVITFATDTGYWHGVSIEAGASLGAAMRRVCGE